MSKAIEAALEGWETRAACAGTDPDYWELETHPSGEVPRFARNLCLQCPVLLQCAMAARRDRADGVIRAATACRRADKAQREGTNEALDRVLLAALLADRMDIPAAERTALRELPAIEPEATHLAD